MTTRFASATLYLTSLHRPLYAFPSNVHCSCADIPSQTTRQKSTLDDLLHVRISFFDSLNHSPIAIIAVSCYSSSSWSAPQTTNSCHTYGPETSAYKRPAAAFASANFMYTLRPGRKDLPRDSLDVCLFFCFFRTLFDARDVVPYCIAITFQSLLCSQHSIDFLALFSILFGRRETRGIRRPNNKLSKLSMFCSDKFLCLSLQRCYDRES